MHLFHSHKHSQSAPSQVLVVEEGVGKQLGPEEGFEYRGPDFLGGEEQRPIDAFFAFCFVPLALLFVVPRALDQVLGVEKQH